MNTEINEICIESKMDYDEIKIAVRKSQDSLGGPSLQIIIPKKEKNLQEEDPFFDIFKYDFKKGVIPIELIPDNGCWNSATRRKTIILAAMALGPYLAKPAYQLFQVAKAESIQNFILYFKPCAIPLYGEERRVTLKEIAFLLASMMHNGYNVSNFDTMYIQEMFNSVLKII